MREHDCSFKEGGWINGKIIELCICGKYRTQDREPSPSAESAFTYNPVGDPLPSAERVWPCEHYRYDESCASEWLREYFVSEDVKYSPRRHDFKFMECPICKTPRPEEKPRTLAQVMKSEAEKWAQSATTAPSYEFYESLARAAAKWYYEKVESVGTHAFSQCMGADFIEKAVLLRAIEGL